MYDYMIVRGELDNLFYNRLVIETYSGLKWRTDIRDYKKWLDLFMSKGENTVMIELPEEEMYDEMVSRMKGYGIVGRDIVNMLHDITGKWLYDYGKD